MQRKKRKIKDNEIPLKTRHTFVPGNKINLDFTRIIENCPNVKFKVTNRISLS